MLYAVCMQITLTTNIEIPESVLESVLTTAVEGGISYWADGDRPVRGDDLLVKRVDIWADDDPETLYTLDASLMAEGVKRLHAAIMKGDVHPDSEIGGQFMRHLFERDGLDLIDSVAADAVVQMACFGEIVYG